MLKYYVQLTVLVAVILGVNQYVGRPIKVLNDSMEPLAEAGDIVWVDKLAVKMGKIRRGDLVVFDHPDDLGFDLKRIAGLPGENIYIKLGQIFINGRPTKNELIRDVTYYNWGQYGQVGKTVKVPPGHYYVLGDNSSESKDSRYWGFLPKKNIIGKAKSVILPPGNLSFIK